MVQSFDWWRYIGCKTIEMCIDASTSSSIFPCWMECFCQASISLDQMKICTKSLHSNFEYVNGKKTYYKRWISACKWTIRYVWRTYINHRYMFSKIRLLVWHQNTHSSRANEVKVSTVKWYSTLLKTSLPIKYRVNVFVFIEKKKLNTETLWNHKIMRWKRILFKAS